MPRSAAPASTPPRTGSFELELNGARVGDDELAPGWTAYESRLRYVDLRRHRLLQPGANVLGAWLGDGWWRGHLGWDGRRELYGSELGARPARDRVRRRSAPGRRHPGPTGSSGAGPIRSSDLYNGEELDARLHDPAWSTASFDAGDWAPVAVAPVRPDGARRSGRPAGASRRDADGAVGHDEPVRQDDPRLRPEPRRPAADPRARRRRATIVTLRHAEVLEHGELATAPLRAAKATDTYTLRGGDAEEWAPRFTFHGFRYAEVTGWPASRRRCRGDHRGGAALRHGAHRLVHGIRPARGPAAPERRVGHARQRRRRAHRLPAARRAPRLDG